MDIKPKPGMGAFKITPDTRQLLERKLKKLSTNEATLAETVDIMQFIVEGEVATALYNFAERYTR